LLVDTGDRASQNQKPNNSHCEARQGVRLRRTETELFKNKIRHIYINDARTTTNQSPSNALISTFSHPIWGVEIFPKDF
jgi:hypothetical protein